MSGAGVPTEPRRRDDAAPRSPLRPDRTSAALAVRPCLPGTGTARWVDGVTAPAHAVCPQQGVGTDTGASRWYRRELQIVPLKPAEPLTGATPCDCFRRPAMRRTHLPRSDRRFSDRVPAHDTSGRARVPYPRVGKSLTGGLGGLNAPFG